MTATEIASTEETTARVPRLDEEPEVVKFARVDSVQYEGDWEPAKYDPESAKAVMDASIDEAVLAEQLGYDALLLTEHHFDGWTMVPSPNVFLAAVAARTSRIRLGHAVRILPLHDPWHLAEETGMLDIISNGRAEIGVGKGNFSVERARFGVDAAEMEARYNEKLQLLTRALNEYDVTFDGTYDRVLVPSTVYPRPFGPPLMPWVSASRPESVEAVARAGHNLFATGRATLAPGTLDRYVAAADSVGLKRTGANFGVIVGMIIAPTDKEAERIRQEATESAWETLNARGFPAEERDGWCAFQYGMSPIGTPDPLGPIAIGSPERVLDVLGTMLTESGMRRLLVIQRLRSLPEEVSRQTMHLFSEHVIPHLRHLTV